MNAYYIERIEIDRLWNRFNVRWNLRPDVNVLSGVNGAGKTTILNKVINYLETVNHQNKEVPQGVRIDWVPAGATALDYDIIRCYDRVQQLAYPKQLSREEKDGFCNIVDQLFAYTGKTIDRSSHDLVFKLHDIVLHVEQLSAGEKQMLNILLTALAREQAPCVLLMDEPEASLHIEWQHKLIALIRTLNPNVQLILSTHSPAVIMEGWMDSVTEVTEITVPIENQHYGTKTD